MTNPSKPSVLPPGKPCYTSAHEEVCAILHRLAKNLWRDLSRGARETPQQRRMKLRCCSPAKAVVEGRSTSVGDSVSRATSPRVLQPHSFSGLLAFFLTLLQSPGPSRHNIDPSGGFTAPIINRTSLIGATTFWHLLCSREVLSVKERC